jgi:hypothetical protein
MCKFGGTNQFIVVVQFLIHGLVFSQNEMLEYKISSVIEVDIFRHGLLLYIYYCDKHLLRQIEHIITCLETLYFILST